MKHWSRRKVKHTIYSISQVFDVATAGRWMLICVAVGIIAGLSALLFSSTLKLAEQIAIDNVTGISLPSPSGDKVALEQIIHSLGSTLDFNIYSLIIIVPAIGGLISGWLITTYSPESEGHGTDAVIKAYHKYNGVIRLRVSIVKFLSSVSTIGTGGSAGKEGPIAQISASIASYVGQKLRLTPTERRIIMMAGLGAGIGAIFKAPIGGALFASEVLYRRDFESSGSVAAILSSIVAYSIYGSVTGWEPVFTYSEFQFTHPAELPLFIVLALICTVIGVLYTKVFIKAKTLFQRITIPRVLKPALGGLMLGMMAYFMPAILGSGYGYLQMAIDGDLTIRFMLLLALLKIIATSVTIQSGGSGGVFAPSLVIGGLIGCSFGLGLAQFYPAFIEMPSAYVLVGMAAFFASVANVPIAATILITEMSQGYGLLVPLIFASAIAHIGSQNWSLYTEQLSDLKESVMFRNDFLSQMLTGKKVRDVFKKVSNIPVIDIRATVHEIFHAFGTTEVLILPVKNQHNQIVGMISLHDVKALIDQQDADIIIAADIMVPPKLLHLNDTLNKAGQYFMLTDIPELLVLQNAKNNQFVGVVEEHSYIKGIQQDT